jgi:hypothetical protein
MGQPGQGSSYGQDQGHGQGQSRGSSQQRPGQDKANATKRDGGQLTPQGSLTQPRQASPNDRAHHSSAASTGSHVTRICLPGIWTKGELYCSHNQHVGVTIQSARTQVDGCFVGVPETIEKVRRAAAMPELRVRPEAKARREPEWRRSTLTLVMRLALLTGQNISGRQPSAAVACHQRTDLRRNDPALTVCARICNLVIMPAA